MSAWWLRVDAAEIVEVQGRLMAEACAGGVRPEHGLHAALIASDAHPNLGSFATLGYLKPAPTTLAKLQQAPSGGPGP
jgi:hypothetical protein